MRRVDPKDMLSGGQSSQVVMEVSSHYPDVRGDGIPRQSRSSVFNRQEYVAPKGCLLNPSITGGLHRSIISPGSVDKQFGFDETLAQACKVALYGCLGNCSPVSPIIISGCEIPPKDLITVLPCFLRRDPDTGYWPGTRLDVSLSHAISEKSPSGSLTTVPVTFLSIQLEGQDRKAVSVAIARKIDEALLRNRELPPQSKVSADFFCHSGTQLSAVVAGLNSGDVENALKGLTGIKISPMEIRADLQVADILRESGVTNDSKIVGLNTVEKYLFEKTAQRNGVPSDVISLAMK